MRFKKHLELDDRHAFLGASNYHWLNYDADKLRGSWINQQAKLKGTELHEIAAKLIKNRIRMPKNKEAFNAYVNDAIGYNMTPEVHLFYSDFCFGTADTISYSRGILRIHDLKTGKTPPSMQQLLIYAAIFFLEYGEECHIDVGKTKVELRIYQKGMPVVVYKPSSEEIFAVINKIKDADMVLTNFVYGGDNRE